MLNKVFFLRHGSFPFAGGPETRSVGIWDGKSFGTLANAFRLIDQGKKVVVIVRSEETSVTTIRSQGDWNRFVSDCAPDLRQRLVKIAQPTTAATSGEKRAGLF